jgi:hypothetical protein
MRSRRGARRRFRFGSRDRRDDVLFDGFDLGDVVAMKFVVSAMLVVVAIIHLLPLSGVVGRERLRMLYGISIDEPNLLILMRHRAVLFGVLGAFFLVAAFDQRLQIVALVAGFASVVPFLWLARSVGGYSAGVARVYRADVVALLSLVVGTIAYAIS